LETLKYLASCILLIGVFLTGCASASEEYLRANEVVPYKFINKLDLNGEIAAFDSALNLRFKEYVESFYRSPLGKELHSQFLVADSTFDLKNFTIFKLPKTDTVADKNEDKVIQFVFHYIQERITPSYIYSGAYAKSIGGFELIITQKSKDLVTFDIKPRDFQVKGKFNCSIVHGVQCGETANRVLSAKFEENIILHYLNYIFEKEGLI